MSRYAAYAAIKEGYSIIVLTDSGSHASAEIIPEVGNNLFRFEIDGHQVIMPPLSLQALKNDATTAFKYGIPILFPPNRVKNGHFTYNGRDYSLPLNEPGNHLHGEISTKGWEVLEFGVSEELGAFVTSRFLYASHPEILAYFPHRLSFTITYRLYEGRLHMSATIFNEDEVEAPFAFGLHPYFYVPFVSQREIILRIPNLEEWPVTNEAFVTGIPSITPFCRDLNEGVSIASYPELGCSLLSLGGADLTCRIEMRDLGYAIAYQLDHQFPYVVLFRPD